MLMPEDYWMGGVAYQLTPASVVAALREYAPARSFTTSAGLLVACQTVSHGLTLLPVPPRSRPFRMLFLVRDGCLALAQRCVDPAVETIGAVDFGMYGANGADLVMVANARWLVFDDSAADTRSRVKSVRRIQQALNGALRKTGEAPTALNAKLFPVVRKVKLGCVLKCQSPFAVASMRSGYSRHGRGQSPTRTRSPRKG